LNRIKTVLVVGYLHSKPVEQSIYVFRRRQPHRLSVLWVRPQVLILQDKQAVLSIYVQQGISWSSRRTASCMLFGSAAPLLALGPAVMSEQVCTVQNSSSVPNSTLMAL
jgi:hypothetical protein